MPYRVFDKENREWVHPDKILISCGENKLLTCGNAVFGWQKLKELPEDEVRITGSRIDYGNDR